MYVSRYLYGKWFIMFEKKMIYSNKIINVLISRIKDWHLPSIVFLSSLFQKETNTPNQTISQQS